MTISFIGQGTTPSGVGTGTGTTSISPDLPAGPEVGDLLVLFVGAKDDLCAINIPTGWIPVGRANLAGGGGVTGADTGPTRCAAFIRQVDGSESAPTVSVTSGLASWAQISLFRSDRGPTVSWGVAGTAGSDTTTGTAWSAGCAAAPGFTVGDYVIVGSVIPTDVSTPAQFSAEAITASGATFAAVTELSEPDTTQGTSAGGFIFLTNCTAGSSLSVPVVTATAGGTTTNVRGVSVVLRIRDRGGANVAAGCLAVSRQAVSRASRW